MDMNPTVVAALIAGGLSAASLTLQIVFRRMDALKKRDEEVMNMRRQALHEALDVIDHVYGNKEWDALGTPNPHEWDISLAHSAMNKMILYCARPSVVLGCFNRVLGNQKIEDIAPSVRGGPMRPEDLSEFRAIVAEELGLSKDEQDAYRDGSIIWLGSLPGTKGHKQAIEKLRALEALKQAAANQPLLHASPLPGHPSPRSVQGAGRRARRGG